MATLTISNKIIKDDAVLISQKEYQSLAYFSKIGEAMERLPKGVREGLEDIRRGRTYGPFNTHEEMMRSLRSNIKRVRNEKKN
jgi:PHD/YefM family antitoxin component YafN of YafNO toxin-antitoxin module